MNKIQIRNTLLLTVFFLSGLSSSALLAQNWDKIDVEIQKDGKKLIHACIPGMVAPQFANYDFDGNGSEDILVFDRAGRVLMPFVWRSGGESGRLEYDPFYVAGFPEVRGFVRLIDFDRDGDRDLFTESTGQSSGISVYQNNGTEAQPDFQQLFFPINYKDTSALYVFTGDFPNEVLVPPSDVPSILDVDGDGDVDVLAFDAGGSSVVYYRNMQEERNLPTDSLVFIIQDKCWGKFKEAGLNSEVVLDSTGTGCAGGMKPTKGTTELRHAGSTLEVLDSNGDGLLDVIVGDLSSDGLVLLINGGEPDDAWIQTLDTAFPSTSEQVKIRDYVSSFYVDVDNDGVRELIATTNRELGLQNINHVWLYENVGTDASPVFELSTKNFLFEDSPSIPDASNPLFIDLNADGLQDLLVGTLGYLDGASNLYASLFRFDNVGTTTEPVYEFVTDNYLNLAADETLSRISPTAADLDADGDQDILFGNVDGKLIYFENTAGPSAPAAYAEGVYQYMGIDIGSTAKPYLIDMDGDGLLDLLVGEQGLNQDETTQLIGSINYFRNIGTVTAPQYAEVPDNSALGGVNTKLNGFTTRATSSPVVFPNETGDDLLLLSGSEFGEVYLYGNIRDNLQGEFAQVSADLPILSQGKETTLDVYDIDNDNYYEMVVGSYNGGIVFYNTPYRVSFGSATEDTQPQQAVSLYPNPATDRVTVSTLGPLPDRYSITRIDGRQVASGLAGDGQIDVSALSAGVYVMSLYWQEGAIHKKLVVQH